MVYNVRVDSIAVDISDEVKRTIIDFLRTYEFPYVTSVENKTALRELFIYHFENRRTLNWLTERVYSLATTKNLRGVSAVSWTESNRVHTAGLGNLLLSKRITECTTVHSYGAESMAIECRMNLEGRILDIKEILNNSFPPRREQLSRKDIPMIPQHINCRHVMAPIDSK